MDTIDLRILHELQRDAKLTNVELAERVKLSPSPCLVRVRALEEAGVIRRYVTLLDPRAMGLDVSVFIQVRLDRQVDNALRVFEDTVKSYPEVMECYLMTGDSDYLLRVVVADVDALQKFIVDEVARIPGVANIRSSFALKQVKFETALPFRPPGVRQRSRATTRS